MILTGDCLEVMKGMADNSVDSIVTDPPYGLSFMGKKWDYDVPSVAIWREALRVLKPGGHLLAFSGSRTYHRMVVNIEDAGFEIRDQIMWLYGSGFPKSHNISKAIDKASGAERIEARQWEGWGSALKPAHEPIVVARKPLIGTIVENVLEYGTGGINIDGSRISHNEPVKHTQRKQRSAGWNTDNCGFDSTKNTQASADESGRFPANVIHDGSDEVVSLFPYSTSGAVKEGTEQGFGNAGAQIYGKAGVGDFKARSASEGSAARFFYCAKPSQAEREAGCESMGETQMGRNQSSLEGGKMLTGSGNERSNGKKNFHPTVKPIALMEYLCKLVTPPGGVVLDPFTGSGTTGIAALRLGFGFIGIEMNGEYVEIITNRISHWVDMDIEFEGEDIVMHKKPEAEWL